LARRVNYIKAFKEKFKGIPMMLVDSGTLFSEHRTRHGGTRIDGAVQNEWLLKAHDQFRVDVANPSAADLGYLAKFLGKAEFAKRSETQPIFKRLVSTNVVTESPNLVKLPPYVVREIALANSSKPVRLAFLGLAEPGDKTPEGIKIADPIESVNRVMPEVKRQADIIIVLSRLKTDVAARLAKEVQGITIVINGNGDMFTPSFRMGETLITFTPFETRFLGELRFYRGEQGTFSFRERFISLDEGVPDDAEAMQIINSVKEDKVTAYKAAQVLLPEWLGKARAQAATWNPATAQSIGAGAPVYISSQACAQCHTEQYFKFVNSKHARASDSLVLDKMDFDASCLQCHATGGKGEELPKLASVQCEQCHGPGSQHAFKPAKGYGRVNDLKSACLSCHTSQASPGFDLQAAWLKIKH
jgi:mono/diheme cytochrome c family protein